MGKPETTVFTSKAGGTLDSRLWLPNEAPRAVLQLVHGMAEHIDRYHETARQFTKAGFAVVGHTHLGHGPRAEVQGHFAEKSGWDALIEDTHSLRLTTSSAYPDIPYFLLGHSMGSFVVRTYCLQHEHGLSGVILSGTGHYPPPIVMAGLMIANLQCAFGLGKKPSHLLEKISSSGNNSHYDNPRTPFDWLSSDEAEVDTYIADPHCGFTFTARAYRDMFCGLKRLFPKNLNTMQPNIPILLFSGDMDPVGGYGKGVKSVATELRNAGVKDVTVKLYPKGRHEMFNETDRALVWMDLLRWMENVAFNSK